MLFSLLTSSNVSWSLVIVYIIASVIVIFVSLPIHEFAHGFVANKLGDPTAKYSGRLSLNPLKHIDYIGAAAILIFGFGWAKPVPVNMRNFKNPKRGMAITALAGPVSNILLAFLSLIVSNIFLVLRIKTGLVSLVIVSAVFSIMADINITLGIFNLVPIPPLDGSRLLNAFLPDRIYYKIMQYENYCFLAIIILVYVFGDFIDIVSDKVAYGLNVVASLPFQAFFS